MELHIFIRNNMLRIEEIIFGKTYSDLFEEFKKMLAAAGAPVVSTLEDSWHHIPLSEVLVVVVALPLIECFHGIILDLLSASEVLKKQMF